MARDYADDYEDEDEDEEEEELKPKRVRQPIDWALWIMIVGTLAFIGFFGAVTVMAPRRPFMAIRIFEPGGKPPAEAGATAPKPADTAPVAPAPPPAKG